MTNQENLGLCNEPVRQFLYIAQDEAGSGACWYTLDHSRTPPAKTPVPQRGCRGYITGIRVANVKTQKHGTKAKLDIFINAGDESFAIRSGVETTFARGLIQSLLAIEDPTQAQGVLTIVAAPSKENTKIVFGSVYVGAQRVKFDWDKDMDLHDPIRVLQGIFGNGGQELPDDHSDSDDVPDSEAAWNQGEPPPSSPDSEEERRHQLQVREIKRVGALAGLAFEPGTENESLVELNQHCGNLHKNADGTPKTIEQLTRDEAIAYRKTLLSM